PGMPPGRRPGARRAHGAEQLPAAIAGLRVHFQGLWMATDRPAIAAGRAGHRRGPVRRATAWLGGLVAPPRLRAGRMAAARADQRRLAALAQPRRRPLSGPLVRASGANRR